MREQLYVWDEQLAAAGADVMRMRQEFVDSLSTLARDLHRSISGGREQLAVSYAPSVDAARYGGTEREALQEALYASALDDIRRGFTTMGPHRDDLSVCLGDAPVRVFGSQGQQRTAALSLKLSELALLTEEKGEPPCCFWTMCSPSSTSRANARCLRPCGIASASLPARPLPGLSAPA